MVVQRVSLPAHSSRVSGSILSSSYCLCGSSHVLFMSTWVSFRFSCFHLPPKNMPVFGLAILNCPEVACLCIPSREYSQLTHSVPGTDSRSTVSLKQLLVLKDWMINKFLFKNCWALHNFTTIFAIIWIWIILNQDNEKQKKIIF